MSTAEGVAVGRIFTDPVLWFLIGCLIGSVTAYFGLRTDLRNADSRTDEVRKERDASWKRGYEKGAQHTRSLTITFLNSFKLDGGEDGK